MAELANGLLRGSVATVTAPTGSRKPLKLNMLPNHPACEGFEQVTARPA